MTHGFPIFKLEIKYATIIWSLSAFGNWNACNQKNERRRCLHRDGLHSALMVLFSALIFLKLSGSISRNQKPFNLAEKFSPFSFFLFAVHMPFLLACVQNLWLRFLPMKNPVFCLLEYFGANIVIVALGTFAGVILRKICPMLFGILNGGRG